VGPSRSTCAKTRAAMAAVCADRISTMDHPAEPAGSARQHATWSPYDNNGGTVLAVAGKDYCIVAGSTRLSTGYSILTRDHSKLAQLSPTCVLATSGFQGDMATLTKRLTVRRSRSHRAAPLWASTQLS
jgi:20S proteasome alpha/beta subunit